MLYEPNKIKWNIGDIVIHDADAKEARMLMQVVDLKDNDLYVTEYVDQSYGRYTWENDLRFLHDPARFGVMKK